MISAPEAEAAHHERPLRYLIARHENNRLELLTLATSSDKAALPVFGTERAARSDRDLDLRTPGLVAAGGDLLDEEPDERLADARPADAAAAGGVVGGTVRRA
jgi:hypothetical protein